MIDAVAAAEGVVGDDQVAVPRVVLLHRGAEQRAGGQERHAHGAGEEPQRQRQHRPVLDGEPSREDLRSDEGLGHRIRIRLADEGRDETPDQPADDE